ncbi:MAG TPA: hypothetical protein V6D05_01645 [Stenomitos sp.]
MGTQPIGFDGGTGPIRLRTPTSFPNGPQPLASGPDPLRRASDANQVAGRAGDPPAATGAAAALLAKQDELSAKKLELAKKQMELKAKEEPKGLWGRVSSWAENTFDKVKHEAKDLGQQIATLEAQIAEMAKDGGHAVATGAAATVAGLRSGKGVRDSLEAGVDAAGTTVAKEIISPMLDRSALGAGVEAADKHDVLGPVLTNRLAMGESAKIKLEAGATLPLEALGIPNARIDGAGTLEIKRMPKLGSDGQPLTEPKDANGMPPSELKVTVTLEGQAGSFYSAEAGVQGGVDVGDYTLGVNASARTEAEAGLKGKVAVTFSFDPQKTSDMNALGGMIKATAETGALSTFPGLGPFLGSAEAVHDADDFRQFGRRIESVEGEGGLYAQANASLSADAGIFEKLDTDEAGKTEKAYTDKGSELTSFDDLCKNIGALEGALGGEAKLGGKVNLRTGEKTVYVSVQGAEHAGAYLGALGKDADAAANRKLAITFDKQGKLKGVQVQTEVTKSQFEGIKSTVEDIYGRPLNQGLIAGIGDEDKVRINYELKPEHRERIAKMLEGSVADKANALKELTGMTIDPNTVKLDKGDVVAVHTDSFSIGGSLKVSMGAVAGVRARMTLARGQESVVD